MPRILVRAITPKRAKVVDFAKFEREITDAIIKEHKPRVKKDFEGTVEGWENKPVFQTRLTIRTDRVTLLVWPSGDNANQYNLVSAGSPAHRIPGSGVKRMSFKAGYKSATRPGSLKSSAKVRSGPIVGAQVVNHPGFEGRDFYKQIAKKNQPAFRRDQENALRRAARSFRRQGSGLTR